MKSTVAPTALCRIASETSCGVRTVVPSTATITSVGCELPGGGQPALTPETSAPVGDRAHLLAERAQRDRGGDLLRPLHVREVDLALLAVVTPGGTTSAAVCRSAPSCSPPNSRSSSVALRTITSTK